MQKVLTKLELDHCVLKIDYINSNGYINILEVDFDVPGDYFETVMSCKMFGYSYLEYYLEHYIIEYNPNLTSKEKKDGEILFVYKTKDHEYKDKVINQYKNWVLIDYNENFSGPPISNNDRIATFLKINNSSAIN